MIKFSREGTRVKIDVSASVMGYHFTFYHELKEDYLAELMRQDYQNHLEKRIEEIRRDEYNQGWRDAKSKKIAKRTWFKSWW